MSSRNNRTKIVATVGPATDNKDSLRKLILEGVNVFRVNFSHGSHEIHSNVINLIHELNDELHTNIAVLADLQGPKLRIGEVENNGVILQEGQILEFVSEKCLGTAQKVYMSYHLFAHDVNPGDRILIDDGKLLLEAIETNGVNSVKARVIHGGKLSSKKGVNLPNTIISLPSLTEKDIIDANFALDCDVDWIALSFVRSASDVLGLKELIKLKGKITKVVAKIEKPEAIAHLDSIISESDAIMVARGDLGVEMPFNQVPILQKNIVEKCVKYAKPVIIATQMLESMIENATPTRAEANDVANAVIDGASAVMLSGETGVGKYPVEVIHAMKEIICYTEENGYNYDREHCPTLMNKTFLVDSICLSAVKMAQQTYAKAIVALTYSGYTAFRIASHRVKSEVFAFSPIRPLIRQMSLLWGVQAVYSPEFMVAEDAIAHTIKVLAEKNVVEENDFIVHLGKMPLNIKGRTNLVKLTQYHKS